MKNTNVVDAVQHNIEERARQALETQREITEKQEQLENHKVFFRDLANGDKMEIPVEGLGKISVKSPVAGGVPQEHLNFDPTAFDALDPKTKKRLLALGVVKKVTTVSQGRAAAVTFALNV